MFYPAEGTKYIQNLLQTFGALPAVYVMRWLERHQPDAGRTDRIELRELSRTSKIYYDPKTDYCYQVYGLNYDLNDTICFAAILALLDTGEFHVGKANYPFDYIAEHNEKLYQIINFTENGPYKLRFRRNLAAEIKADTIPLIIVNDNQKDFTMIDYNGNMEFVPDQDYVIARFKYTPEDKMNPVNIQLFEHEGGKF